MFKWSFRGAGWRPCESVPNTYRVHTIVDGFLPQVDCSWAEKGHWDAAESSIRLQGHWSQSSSANGQSCWRWSHKMLQPAGGCWRWRPGSEPLDSWGGRCLSGDYGRSSLQGQSKLPFWNGPWLVRREDVWHSLGVRQMLEFHFKLANWGTYCFMMSTS